MDTHWIAMASVCGILSGTIATQTMSRVGWITLGQSGCWWISMGNAMAGVGIHVIDICILVVESKKD